MNSGLKYSVSGRLDLAAMPIKSKAWQLQHVLRQLACELEGGVDNRGERVRPLATMEVVQACLEARIAASENPGVQVRLSDAKTILAVSSKFGLEAYQHWERRFGGG